MYISYQIEIQCIRYASCTITWMFKYIPYPDLLTDLSEKYIRLVVHILVLIHRVRVSDSGTNYSKFSQEAVHTAPEWCQPEMFATLSFSAVLFVCDQDKNLHVAQQIF